MKSNEEIKKELRLRDRVIRVLAKDKQIRAIAVKNTVAVKTAQKNHELGFVPATLLAKMLSGNFIDRINFKRGRKSCIRN